MKVTSINYQKVFPLGQYINERIGVEIQVDANEDENECLRQAKLLVERFHKDNNPHLYQEQESEPIVIYGEPLRKSSDKKPQIESYIDDILAVTDPEKLKNEWSLLAKSNPKLQQAYESKLKQLTNK